MSCRPPSGAFAGVLSLQVPTLTGHYGSRSKVKVQYYVLPWYLEELGVLIWPNSKFPPYSALVGWGPLAKQTSLLRKPGKVPAYLWVVGFSSLPACEIIQTSQSHPSTGTGAQCPLDIAEPNPHNPWLFTLSLGAILCDSTWHAVSSSRCAVTNKLLSTSTVQCQVSCVQPSLLPRGREWIGGDQNRWCFLDLHPSCSLWPLPNMLLSSILGHLAKSLLT